MAGEGAAAQAGNPLAGLLQNPYLQMGLSYLMDNMLSGSSALLKYSNMTTGQSIAANWERARTSQLQAAMFGSIMDAQSSQMTRNLIAGGYRALGYDAPSAYYNAGKTGMGMIGWGVDTFLGDQWRAGLSNMYSAAFSRRAYEAPDGRYYRMRTDYRELGDTLLKQHFEQGLFGSASFREVGGVAAALIRSGRYDYYGRMGGRRMTTNANGEFIDAEGNRATGDVLKMLQEQDAAGTGYWERNQNGNWQLTKRSDAIARDVREYSRALTKLQDVIGGDMNQVLDTLDKLFGSNATTLSAQRLNNITSNLRHSMTATGFGLQQMATMAGVGFSYIGPYGGTEVQGMQMANTAAYFLGAGISVEGVKSDIYGSSLLMHQANRMVSGDARYMAAAYVAYADANNLDVHDRGSYQKFVAALGDTSRTAGSLNEWMRQNGPQGAGASYYSAILNSDRTTNLIGEFDITMDMMQNDVMKANRARGAQYKGLVDRLNKRLGGNMTVESLLGGDYTTMSSDQVYEAVMKSASAAGMSRADARVLAAEASNIQRNTARRAFYGMSAAEAEQTMINAEKARSAKEASLFQDAMADVYGDALSLLEEGRAGGLEGVMQSLMSGKKDKEAMSVADVMLGAIGLTSEQSELLDKKKLRSQGYLTSVFNQNRGTIEAHYKRVFGKSYEGKGGIEGMTKELIQQAMKTRYTSSAIWTGTMKQDAEMKDDSAYSAVRSKALTASMVLQRGNLTDKEKSEALADLKEWADATEGEEAELVSVAIEAGRSDDLWSEEGRKNLQGLVDQRHKIEQYVENSYSSEHKTQRTRLTGAMKRLQGQIGKLTDAQRSEIADAVSISKGGRVVIDGKKLKELGLSAEEAGQIRAGISDVVAAQRREGISNETLEKMARDALTLTNSNDPISILISKLQEWFNQLMERLPAKE